MQPQQISDREFRQERARLAELPFMNVFVCLHLRGRASQLTTKSPELFELAERVSRNSEDTGEAAQVADHVGSQKEDNAKSSSGFIVRWLSWLSSL